MGHLDEESVDRIQSTIIRAIQTKLENYRPETDYKPFHARLLGESRMRLFSFIHSLNNAFGGSIFEPVAAEVARLRFPVVETQVKLPNEINRCAQDEIEDIVNELAVPGGDIVPDRTLQERRIREATRRDDRTTSTAMTQVDLWLDDGRGTIVMIEMTTVKPNSSDFEKFKRSLLKWYAIGQQQHPGSSVKTFLALPYNPYHPQKYRRWTNRGIFDPGNEILIAEDFWNYLAGADIHDELLDCFERVGIELGQEIDDYFARFDRNRT